MAALAENLDTHLDHSHNVMLTNQFLPNVSDTMIAKAVAMITLFSASMLMGTIPLRLTRYFHRDNDIKSTTFVSILLSFGGGVLLCTTFLHLLPEVNESIEELQNDGVIPELPIHLGELLMCLGFFIIFLVEELVHYYLHRREHYMNHQDTASTSHSETYVKNENTYVKNIAAELINNAAELYVGKTDMLQPMQSTDELFKHNAAKLPVEHSHSHTHIYVSNNDEVVANLRGLLVVLALSVHELFEGLAVGLESSAGNVWYMFGAVAAHKLVIAFCVGVELVASKTKKLLTVAYVFTFAVVSPLGIFFGMCLSGGGDDTGHGLVLSVILQGMATGTLLYVVFFEVLKRNKMGLKQYAAVLVGFGIMLALQLLTGHEHGHEHGGHDHDDGENVTDKLTTIVGELTTSSHV